MRPLKTNSADARYATTRSAVQTLFIASWTRRWSCRSRGRLPSTVVCLQFTSTNSCWNIDFCTQTRHNSNNLGYGSMITSLPFVNFLYTPMQSHVRRTLVPSHCSFISFCQYCDQPVSVSAIWQPEDFELDVWRHGKSCLTVRTVDIIDTDEDLRVTALQLNSRQ